MCTAGVACYKSRWQRGHAYPKLLYNGDKAILYEPLCLYYLQRTRSSDIVCFCRRLGRCSVVGASGETQTPTPKCSGCMFVDAKCCAGGTMCRKWNLSPASKTTTRFCDMQIVRNATRKTAICRPDSKSIAAVMDACLAGKTGLWSNVMHAQSPAQAMQHIRCICLVEGCQRTSHGSSIPVGAGSRPAPTS